MPWSADMRLVLFLVVAVLGALTGGAVTAVLVSASRYRRWRRDRRAAGPQLVLELPPIEAAEAFEPAQPEPPPAPPPPAILALGLMGLDAPEDLWVPLEPTRGRILELAVPVRISTAGGRDLQDVRLSVTMPNEITFGGSLERISVEAVCAELPGATAAYRSGAATTTIFLSLPQVPGGAEIAVPVPLSIKQTGPMAHEVRICATGPGLEPVERTYRLRFSPPEACGAVRDGWICAPDAARTRDPRLPLDRISSGVFDIRDGAGPGGDPEAPASLAHSL